MTAPAKPVRARKGKARSDQPATPPAAAANPAPGYRSAFLSALMARLRPRVGPAPASFTPPRRHATQVPIEARVVQRRRQRRARRAHLQRVRRSK